MSKRPAGAPEARRRAPQPPRTGAGVVIAYIHPGETSSYFTTSLTNFLMYDQATTRHIVGCWNEWSSANVSQARNSLTRRFVEGDKGEWLLWIDADMAWEIDALNLLLKDADPVTAPIVGGLCFGANLGRLFPTIYQMTETAEGRLTTLRMNDYPPDSMVGCAATGAAFLLVHRSVLSAMLARGFNRAFPWFMETEIDGQPAGEDITFCLRAGQLGYPIYVNTAVKVGHHKSHLLTEDLFRAQRAMEAVGE